VSWQESTGIAVAVYTALNGTPLAEAVGAREYSGLAADVTDALASLARSPEPRPPEEWWARLVEPRLEMLAAQTGMLDEPELADATRSALSRLERLPLVWAHNDCSPWNMLLMPGGFGLLDWETAVRDGLPLVDVVYCLAMMAMIDDGTTDTAAETRTYSGLLDPADERGSVFAENLQAYASKVGLAEADIAPLRVATWLEHATNDLRNLQRDAGERSPLLLRESVTLPLLRLELAAMGLYDPGGPA
jgi:aminoglycoside phosphotransferase (APT) family kinase protein